MADARVFQVQLPFDATPCLVGEPVFAIGARNGRAFHLQQAQVLRARVVRHHCGGRCAQVVGAPVLVPTPQFGAARVRISGRRRHVQARQHFVDGVEPDLAFGLLVALGFLRAAVIQPQCPHD